MRFVFFSIYVAGFLLVFPPGISAGYFYNRKLEATRPGRRLLIIQHRPAVRPPSICALPVPRAVANRFPPTRTNLRARLERVLLVYADAKDGGGAAPHGCVIYRHRLWQPRHGALPSSPLLTGGPHGSPSPATHTAGGLSDEQRHHADETFIIRRPPLWRQQVRLCISELSPAAPTNPTPPPDRASRN